MESDQQAAPTRYIKNHSSASSVVLLAGAAAALLCVEGASSRTGAHSLSTTRYTSLSSGTNQIASHCLEERVPFATKCKTSSVLFGIRGGDTEPATTSSSSLQDTQNISAVNQNIDEDKVEQAVNIKQRRRKKKPNKHRAGTKDGTTSSNKTNNDHPGTTDAGGDATDILNSNSVRNESESTENNDGEKPRSPSSERHRMSGERSSSNDHPRESHDNKKDSESTSPADKKKSKSMKNNKNPQIVDAILKETDYYKILGLHTKTTTKGGSNPITTNDIQKAYRRRAVQTHPDKTGGDRRAFDKVAEAYDVLSDSKKRDTYDRYGKKGLEQGMGGASAGNAEDLFRSFFFGNEASSNPFFNFGAGSSRQQQQQRRMNRTMRCQLEISLEDMYNGITRSVQLQVQQQYDPLSGKPVKNGASGKSVEVEIPKGALDEQHIVLSGAIDMNENETPGDLIFILKQRPHKIFSRKGYDLACQIDISLSEALCGFDDKTILHLNGKSIAIASARHRRQQPRQSTLAANPDATKTSTSADSSYLSSTQWMDDDPVMIRTGDVQVLKGFGMPKDSQGMSYGDLYIQFNVNMPSTSSSKTSVSPLTPEEQIELKRLLNKLDGIVVDDASRSSIANEKKKDGERSTVSRTGDTSKAGENINVLQEAKLSDFGRASGQPLRTSPHGDDEHFFGDDDTARNGFSSSDSTRRYYWSSSSSGGTGGADPFGFFSGSAGHSSNDDDHTQCRQM